MQGTACLHYSSPNAALGHGSLLWSQNPNHQEAEDTEWGLKDQRQNTTRMLHPSAYERVWARSEDTRERLDSETLPGPEELKTVNEGQERAGSFKQRQSKERQSLPLGHIFCMILMIWFLM